MGRLLEEAKEMVDIVRLAELTYKLQPKRKMKKPSLALFIREHLREKGLSGDYLFNVFTGWNKIKKDLNPKWRQTSYDSFRQYFNKLKRLGLVIHLGYGPKGGKQRRGFQRSRYRISEDGIRSRDWLDPANAYNRRFGNSMGRR